MKIVFCLALCIVAITAESCNRLSDCQETQCKQEDGWWLHCNMNICLCSHDTYTGKPCPTGQTSECEAAHTSRCQDNNLVWHCVDSTCHCTKPRG